MGQQNRYKSLAAVIQAFIGQKVWAQAALARKVGLSTAALRTLLRELQASGMRLHQEAEPPQIYWSVEKGWLPGGTVLSEEDYPTLLRAVFALPESSARQSLLKKILGTRGGEEAVVRVSSRSSSEEEELAFVVVQAALLEHKAMRIRYLTQSRGAADWRVVSPQRLVPQPRPRLLAWCHQARELRWFRLDNVLRATLAEQEPFQVVQEAAVKRVLEESVDGFHAPKAEAQGELAFSVRYPEANWVKANLLSSMAVDEPRSSPEALRIVCGARGAPVVARFVVGLGDAAKPEGPLLKELVRGLAEGALRAQGAAARANGKPLARGAKGPATAKAPARKQPSRKRERAKLNG
jgi:predicted DNA-binding transcriptional regulator YafY